jgi:hypothetical protein
LNLETRTSIPKKAGDKSTTALFREGRIEHSETVKTVSIISCSFQMERENPPFMAVLLGLRMIFLLMDKKHSQKPAFCRLHIREGNCIKLRSIELSRSPAYVMPELSTWQYPQLFDQLTRSRQSCWNQ